MTCLTRNISSHICIILLAVFLVMLCSRTYENDTANGMSVKEPRSDPKTLKTTSPRIISPNFIPSQIFTGAKVGFVFKTDDGTTGYYKDIPMTSGKRTTLT